VWADHTRFSASGCLGTHGYNKVNASLTESYRDLVRFAVFSACTESLGTAIVRPIPRNSLAAILGT
jgi:hypothetical protein